MHVVVPCASMVPLASRSSPSAVPVVRPRWIRRPVARISPVSLVMARTKFTLSLERGVDLTLRQRRLHRARHARVHQRHGEAAMHHADWIVVAKFRHAFEHRLAFFGLDQIESEQVGHRRLRQRAVDDRVQEAKAVIGQDLLGRRDTDIAPHLVHVTLLVRKSAKMKKARSFVFHNSFRHGPRKARHDEDCRYVVPSNSLRRFAISLPAKSMKARTRAVWRRSAWVSSHSASAMSATGAVMRVSPGVTEPMKQGRSP